MSTSTIMPVIHPIEGALDTGSLARLHTAVLDAADGIGRIREHADEATALVLDAFADLHAQHNRALVAEMANNGHPPRDGSFHHLLHAGTERLRDLFDAPGDDVLRHVLDLERQVLAAYNAALDQGGPADTIELLQRQREELGNLVIKHDARLAE